MVHSVPETSRGHAQALRRGHEIFDLDVSYVRWFSVAIVVLVAVTAAIAFAMLGGFRLQAAATRQAPAAQGPDRPPFVSLQSEPQNELQAYRHEKVQALEGYRWIDREGGVVQIPIERAMELMSAPAPAARPPASPAARRARGGAS